MMRQSYTTKRYYCTRTFISVINQLDAQNICFTISFISCFYMFRAPIGVMIPEVV